MQTIKDAYALPNLEETFSALTGSKWFSVLDLKSGYYQIEVDEVDKQKTAFVCPLGFWEFNRMPQGITNAPSTFQRLMEKCMGDINLKEVLVFLDDLIVFSETLEEHEARLLNVLNRLRDYGLKLSLEKCKFFQTSVRYLGHIVSQHGVETDPEKVEALKTWPIPKNLKELRSFLGFAGYYRRFIRDYSKIVKPLNDLTVGYPPLRKSCSHKGNKEQYFHVKEPFGARWTQSCHEAFETIIEKLTTAPVLAFANPKLPYVLHTDASTTGLGAALYQEQEGDLRVVAFASRGLSRSEARYPAHKLEFLALKWAVTEKFCDYLYGSFFTVVTDSNPLTYILTTAKLDATSYRWLSALSTFSFQLQYRAGKQNMDADGLSRRPHAELVNDSISQKEQERICQFIQKHLAEPESSVLITKDAVNAACEKHIVYSNVKAGNRISSALVTSLAVSADAIPESYSDCDGLPVIPGITEEELKQKQRSDPSLREVINQLETGKPCLPLLRKELPELPILLRELGKLTLSKGIIYRMRQVGDETCRQLVLPDSLRNMVMHSLHDDMGHLGIDRTLDLVRTRFFWPRMAAHIEEKIKTCSRCVYRKTPPERAAPLVNISASRPLELVCMDFLSLEPDRSNKKDILVITDFFTKYAVAIPTTNQKARTVAKCLWENFIVHYGFPEKLHSDQGPDFESKTIKELCDVAGIHKIRTTPYHPRGNPVERFNRTLLNMLGTLKTENKPRWSEFVKPLVHAYNCTKHDTTGFSPYELMFGRQPKLPIDLVFNISGDQQHQRSHSQYVETLKHHLQESYKLATGNASKTAERNKRMFDKRVTESVLTAGDRVLVKNVKLRGKHKIHKWEPVVHLVVQQEGDFPVYTVKPENSVGPLRTLHRDLLLPCGFLPSIQDRPADVSVKVRRPHTRQNPDAALSEPESNTDDDDDLVYLCPKSVPFVSRSVDEYNVVLDPNDQTRSLNQPCSGNETELVVSSAKPAEHDIASASPEETDLPVITNVTGNAESCERIFSDVTQDKQAQNTEESVLVLEADDEPTDLEKTNVENVSESNSVQN
uniref:Gypsy retrotransposon integrase-like protein 1 n=1 Tax=Oryzias sinensis TaxID=183150 RepID=A0A8C8DED1_9TELE